jgi:hypothetical protein
VCAAHEACWRNIENEIGGRTSSDVLGLWQLRYEIAIASRHVNGIRDDDWFVTAGCINARQIRLQPYPQLADVSRSGQNIATVMTKHRRWAWHSEFVRITSI